MTFGIVTEEDNPDVQPPLFYMAATMCWCAHRRQERTGCTLLCSSFLGGHTEHGCSVCEHSKAIHQPPAHSAITHLYTIAPPSLLSPADLHSLAICSRTSSVSPDDFMCHLCSSIVDRPIQLMTCNRLMCMECLCASLREKAFCCSSDHLHDLNTMARPSPVVTKVLRDLQVTCK